MSASDRQLRLAWLATFSGLSLLLSGCGGGIAASTSVSFLASHPESAEEKSDSESVASGDGATAPASVGFGTLKGKIVYDGAYSPLAPLYPKGGASKDNEVCGLEAAPNEAVLVKDGGLANVFIWLDKVPKGVEVPASDNPPVVFDQKHCVFLPHALIVRTGQTVRVLNSDPIAHNTHTKPERNNEFNSLVDQNGADLVYGRAEKKPFMVMCDIHPWMSAYHLPLDHPYAAISGSDGSFEIPNLPAGKLVFKLWHEAGKELEKAYKVEIKANETTTVEISVPASKVSP